MYADNRHYGHAHVVLTHCGLPVDTPIPVRLQHGWQPGMGMRDCDMREPGPKAVWSVRNRTQAEGAGFSDVIEVGSPYLYLPSSGDPGPTRGERSLLVVPFHGWELAELAGTMDAYAGAIQELAAKGWGPITVCLYWVEYEQPQYREVFEERGFATTTMGHRDNNPDFLSKMRDLLRAHAAVTSNRVMTAAFYALHSERPFFLYGPPVGLSATDDPSGEDFDRWQREAFPELTYESFSQSGELCHRQVGTDELGVALSPEELRKRLLLGASFAKERRRLRWRRWGYRIGKSLRLKT